jgi:hypothetical protein
LEELKQLQQSYIFQAEDKILELVVEDDHGTLKVKSLDGKRLVIPVTGEVSTLVHPLGNTPLNSLKRKIEELSEDCLQIAEEKVSVAEQTYKLVDATVQRLDKDLAAMETLLQVWRGYCHLFCFNCPQSDMLFRLRETFSLVLWQSLMIWQLVKYHQDQNGSLLK